MEKENKVLTDNELKEVSGGIAINNVACQIYNSAKLCSENNNFCFWDIKNKICRNR